MKTTILLISFLCLLPSLIWADDDWRLEKFDRSQELFRAFEKEEAEFMVAINSDVQVFFDVRIPFDEADRKMSRYVFIKQLSENPQAVDWNDPYFWGDLSSAESEALAEQDDTYRILREDFLALKEVFRGAREALRLRNKIYKEHSAELYVKEEELHSDLMLLKNEVLAKMANHTLEP